jgi:hypothetical protein
MPKPISPPTRAGLAGITYQTLNRWLNEGVVTRDVPAEGTGSRRRFTFRTCAGDPARTLKEFGLTMRGVRGILDGVRRGWTDQDPEHRGYLAVQYWTDYATASGRLAGHAPALLPPQPGRLIS